jgi:4-amino-4-deoxy-L-arabinose transferase-like glycosyltransferase
MGAVRAGRLTLSDSRPPPGLPAPRRLWARALTWLSPWLPLAVMALAFVLRIVQIGSAYDINSDEVNYTDLSMSLQHGHFPPLFEGAPFVLHPPGYFTVGAAWLSLLGTHGSYFHYVTALRVLNSLLAVMTAGLIYALGVRLVGRSVGLGAALIFAVDPYILRQNERAMLETSTLAFLIAGYLLLLSLLDRPSKPARTRTAAAGLLLGCAVVCKDAAAILVVGPLLIFMWKDFGLRRRTLMCVLLFALVPYATYVIALTARGYLGFFLSQETLGLRRQLGLDQATGFNAPGSPSLLSVALKQLSQYGVTYLLSGLGAIASVYLIVRGQRPSQRIWSVVALAGTVTLVYSVAFGTIEEQMLYFMYVPAIVALMAAVVVFARSRYEARPLANHRGRRAVALVVVLFTLYDAVVWGRARAVPNDGMARIVAWFESHAPHPGVIANDTEVTALVLRRSGFQAVIVAGRQSAAAAHVRYLTVLSASLVGHYGALDSAQAAFFAHYGRLVYQYRESTYGTMSIYETTAPRIW